MAAERAVLVCGAGSGVGQAAAVALAEAGFAVALAGRTQKKLEDTAALVERRVGPDAPTVVLPVELTDPRAVHGLVDDMLDCYARLDGLVNCAGLAALVQMEKITPELWRQTVDANLSYVMYLTAAAWPVFRQQRHGVIVNISSLSSVDPFPGFALYGAAKVGLNLFTHCTAQEGQAIGVRAVCIAPGAIETPMLRAMFDEQAIPTARTLDPRTVGELVRDCVSGQRPFRNGETILLPSP